MEAVILRYPSASELVSNEATAQFPLASTVTGALTTSGVLALESWTVTTTRPPTSPVPRIGTFNWPETMELEGVVMETKLEVSLTICTDTVASSLSRIKSMVIGPSGKDDKFKVEEEEAVVLEITRVNGAPFT